MMSKDITENMTVVGTGTVISNVDTFRFDNDSEKKNFILAYNVWGKNSELKSCRIKCEVSSNSEIDLSEITKGSFVNIAGQLCINSQQEQDNNGKNFYRHFPVIRLRSISKLKTA